MDAFDRVVDKSSGSADFDGRATKEIKMIEKLHPKLILELHQARVTTSLHCAALKGRVPEEVLDRICPGRVVGIPTGEADMRQISAGAILWRTRLSAPASATPQPRDNQWADERGVSAVRAISKWLVEDPRSEAGTELDLSRVYDFIDHEVGEEALFAGKTPDAAARAAVAARAGPRTCKRRR